MANVLRASPFLLPPSGLSSTPLETPKYLCISFKQRRLRPVHIGVSLASNSLFRRVVPSFLLPFAAYGETAKTDEVEETDTTQENLDGEISYGDGASDSATVDSEEKPESAVKSCLESYKEALANNDESRIAEIEAFFVSMEVESVNLANTVATLTAELAVEKERILRISADFDNFRKRTERERLSLVTNAQGEVVENLLSVLDNFERAKAQIKVETEGEEKINNSYQNIHKQFIEILVSLGVVPVETIGKPFDPLLHEAIMREESTEFEEGIILEEFRKGFKLGDRLLRPAMVKVSAGPGPGKPEEAGTSEDAESASETIEDANKEVGST